MAGAPTDRVRVCPAVPPPASATLLDDVSQRLSHGHRNLSISINVSACAYGLKRAVGFRGFQP